MSMRRKWQLLPWLVLKPLDLNIVMVIVRINWLLNPVICPCHWTQETELTCCQRVAAIECMILAGQRECQFMIPCGILCHIMSQHFRQYIGLFQCYLLLVFEWRQSQFLLSKVTGDEEQDIQTGTHQVQHNKHRNIHVSYAVTRVIIPQTAESRKCHMS